MSYIVFLIVTIIQVGIFAFLMRKSVSGNVSGSIDLMQSLQSELEAKQQMAKRFENILDTLVLKKELQDIATDLLQLQDTLKTERGRSTITTAEVETVETRLRELEEIERELEASSLETKEEIGILRKKHGELKSRNDALNQQLQESVRQMDDVISNIDMSEQAKDQINAIKAELVQCEQRTDVLLLQIEEGNEQYFILKKRYDALDIEYAQLYEKFSSSE